MATAYVSIPPDSGNEGLGGKKIAHETQSIGGNTLYMPRHVISDKTADQTVGVVPKGTQPPYALGTQDFKDAGRNHTNYFMALPIVTTTAEVMMSMTGYKSGAAVGATVSPAVVTAGKTYRVYLITVTYVAIATAGSVRVTLRANLSGLGVIGSPLVWQQNVGGPAAAAGVSQTVPFVFSGSDMEFAAGTGIAVGIQGFGATQAAAAVGYGQVAVWGYEY